jgi:2-polyprenyl-3-methyl-5-hydroxy-6-metoxy-1,4-benzoquinol methylase
MTDEERRRAHEETRQAWNRNAAYWDGRMGEGNDFVEVLSWPATERLLTVQPGERILDVACGNGLTSRRLAVLGAEVVAFDFAHEIIALARQRTTEHVERITYRVLDATDEEALLALGAGAFDGALCSMALFDMAEIAPLMGALARLLRPGGRFVFSVLHPCFNNTAFSHVAETTQEDGKVRTVYGVKVWGYMTPTVERSRALRGQPQAQWEFHRPLQDLFGAAFAAGFVLDGLEERAFPPDHPQSKHLSWDGRFSEIPPVLVARMQLP